MNADYFRTLFGYHYWVRDRILAQVAQLTQEEYVAPRALDYGNIRATFVHALSAEAGYLARWEGRSLEGRINEETVPTTAALQERWDIQQTQMKDYLARLTDAEVNREIHQVSARTGQESVTPLWALMTQLIVHGTQHRAEIALAITQLGHSPGDLDFTLYLREHPA
ncbi:MAG: hypothetical protein EXR58_01005 [Chloroflexi bacterium]|nr:hypothetical protein [Chloroflexota bacterium]